MLIAIESIKIVRFIPDAATHFYAKPFLSGVSHVTPFLFFNRFYLAVVSISFLLVLLCSHSCCYSRSDNFQLVVLDEDDGGVGDGAGSKPAAAENARKFLRDRLGSRKRVSYSLLKARKRVGPSPNF